MLDHAPSPIEDPTSAKSTTKIHPIRAAEDALFQEWVSARLERYPFAADGCAEPGVFQQSATKIVFVLKERNWGHTAEDQSTYADTRKVLSARLEELRADEGRETFDSWWTSMAQWAEVLLATEPVDWPSIQRRFEPKQKMTPEEKLSWISLKNKETLGRCACVQLKKSPGGGTIYKDGFNRVVFEDRDFILRQFAIYSPHFIVSCGSGDNWNIFRNTLFPQSEDKRTRNGIQYFITSSPANGLGKTAVINFGHPSMRVNNSLWGVLAFGLREALDEISALCPDLRVSPTQMAFATVDV